MTPADLSKYIEAMNDARPPQHGFVTAHFGAARHESLFGERGSYPKTLRQMRGQFRPFTASQETNKK